MTIECHRPHRESSTLRASATHQLRLTRDETLSIAPRLGRRERGRTCCHAERRVLKAAILKLHLVGMAHEPANPGVESLRDHIGFAGNK